MWRWPIVLRNLLLCGVLLILLLVLASPISVQAAKKMTLTWQLEGEQTEHGYLITVVGHVLDQDSHSPISEAGISIHLNLTLGSHMIYKNPYGKATITYANITTATTYTNATGGFRITSLIPSSLISSNSTALCTGTEWFPRYFITLVADKAGYDTVRDWMFFPASAGPYGFLSMEASPSNLTIAQGQKGFATVTILTQRDQLVNFAAIDLPPGVTFQFNPPSVVPSETALAGAPITIDVIIAVSYDAPVGNHTITILAVSGVTHRVCIQLKITPFEPGFVLIAGAASIVLVAIVVSLRSRSKGETPQGMKEANGQYRSNNS